MCYFQSMGMFRLGILLVALALAAVGGYLVHYSNRLPEWTDKAKAEHLMAADGPARDLSGSEQQAYNDNWFKQMDALRTPKWPTFDLGSGLIASAAMLAAGMLLLRIGTMTDLRNLRTPRWRLLVLGICVLAWYLRAQAITYSLQQDYDRHMFASWADSIGIGAAGVVLFHLMGLIVLVPLIWFLALWRAQLPASLWVWDRGAPIASWFFSICAVVALVFAANDLLYAFNFGPYFLVPVSWLLIYGALCVRSAAISQFASKISSPQTV